MKKTINFLNILSKKFIINSKGDYFAKDSCDIKSGIYELPENWKSYIEGHLVEQLNIKSNIGLEFILDNGVKLLVASTVNCDDNHRGWYQFDPFIILCLDIAGNVINKIDVACDTIENNDIYKLRIYTNDNQINIDFSGYNNEQSDQGLEFTITIPKNSFNKES